MLEDDETQNFDISDTFSESPGGGQSDPKNSMNAASDSIIVVEDEVETGLPQRRGESSSQNQMKKMGRQLELTGGLLKAKRAELEQLEKKHNEEVNSK